MTTNPRPERVADLIQMELADILARRLKDPRHGFLTVTGVEMSRDLRLARVYVSALDEAELEESLATLERAKGFLRSELARRVRLRILPNLVFKPDRSAEHGLRMASLLRDLEAGTLPPESDEEDRET